MSRPFRLARLLRLREDQARAKKLAWAVEVRALMAAREKHEAAGLAIETARREAGAAREAAGSTPARLAAIAHAEEVTLDAFGAAEEAAGHAAAAALQAEEARRTEFEGANQRLRALERLEHKHRRAERERVRRRDARALDEVLAARTAVELIRRTASEADDR